ncbi:MAG: hypothetical protein AAF412_11345 [Pseudomonadota bacterium]
MDKEFLEELFAPFGEVVVRNMFGGTGIFHRGMQWVCKKLRPIRIVQDA